MSADKKNKFKSIAIKLCAAGITVVVAGLAYLCLMPRTYRATAKVEILKSGANNSGGSDSFDLDKLPGESQTARSDAILDRVIANLNLKQTWSKKLNQTSPLTTDQARDRLRLMLNIQPAENAAVIEIAATGSDPVEPAAIVNEIAKLYCNLRQSGREEASHQGFASLRVKWEAKDKEVQDQQAVVRKMWDEREHERTNSSVPIYDAAAWEASKAQRARLEQEYRNKSNQLAELKQLNRSDLIKALATNDTGTNLLLAGALQRLDAANSNLAAASVVEELNHQVDALLASAISGRELELDSVRAALARIRGMADKAGNATNDLERLCAQDTAYAAAKSKLDNLAAERDTLEHEITGHGLGAAVMPGAVTARIMDLADQQTNPVSPDRKIARTAFVIGGGVAAAGLLLLLLLSLKPRGAEKKAA